MSLLRIHASLPDPPQWCRWALVNDDRDVVTGEGALVELPRHAGRIELVLPAGQVRLARVRLPPAARHDTGAALAYALEEQTAAEPEASQVSWLGTVDGDDALAVFDKPGYEQWHAALAAAGLHEFEVHCETLFLPWAAGTWSVCWNGREGFVRSGEIQGCATDCGGRDAPPLVLALLLAEARANGSAPEAIVVHPTAPEAAPDVAAWTRELGVAVRPGPAWPWHGAPAGAGLALRRERQRWHSLSGLATRLRPAAWILAAALAVHALALAGEWSVLAGERRELRAQLEARFRAVFPDAVAVADPVLQMRRKLADARHVAGATDPADFLPMLGQLADATAHWPPGTVRGITYDNDRMVVELAGVDAAGVARASGRLRDAGLRVEAPPDGPSTGTVVLTVRAP